jgi:hypothetical protein
MTGKTLRILRQNIANSPLAPLAALPLRAKQVGSDLPRETATSLKWLRRSREYTNYTFTVSDLNIEHFAWWVADLSEGRSK